MGKFALLPMTCFIPLLLLTTSLYSTFPGYPQRPIVSLSNEPFLVSGIKLTLHFPFRFLL